MTEFYRGKKVLVTGHTGFKGTWLTKVLVNMGAEVLGYSRCSKKELSLFERSGVEKQIIHVKGDVCDYQYLLGTFRSFQPDIVLHLAAQPIVRESYSDPRATYETNVMGTVNVLEAVRNTAAVKSVVIITTDKVYQNNEWVWGYRENEALDGFDPYSNSKSCAELVTGSYRRSFPALPPISTARAGNVIGGGDFAKDRIIPDCVRAIAKGEPIIVRNPFSIRPYQHVLEPLFAYLLIAHRQYENSSLAGTYNVGPEECDCVTTGELVNLFRDFWGETAGWETGENKKAPHEATYLKLDCTLIKSVFGWQPKWHIDETMKQTVRFYKCWLDGENVPDEMDAEIQEYMNS